MGKHQDQKKKYERQHAHCRLFAALDAASPDCGESACNESARSEPAAADISANEYFSVAKNVIESQEALSQQGSEIDFHSVLYASEALSIAANLFLRMDCAPAAEYCDILIARAVKLLHPNAQESVSLDGIILRPHPPAPR